MFGFSFLASHI